MRILHKYILSKQSDLREPLFYKCVKWKKKNWEQIKNISKLYFAYVVNSARKL